MRDIALAVQLDLALHLGLIAVTITLILWRIADTKDVLKQIKLLSEYRKTGYANSKIIISYLLQCFKLSLKTFAFILSIGVFYFTFKYIKILEIIVGPGGFALDFGVFNSLWHQSEKVTEKTIAFCITVSILFVLDYLGSIIINVFFKTLEEKEIPKCFHVNVIPRNWKVSPESMWESRIKEIQNLYDKDLKEALQERKWLKDWTTWTKCVIGYGIFISREQK